MKRSILSFIAAAVLASCSAPSNKTDKTDTVIAGNTLAKSKDTHTNSTPTISSLCFLNIDGKKDSTSIELVLQGTKVTGVMNWLPNQKDSRKGKLEGVIKDSIINAKWTFMQEGVKDTLNLNFKITNNALLQKPLKLNTKTAREQTDNSAGYKVVYKSAEKLHK